MYYLKYPILIIFILLVLIQLVFADEKKLVEFFSKNLPFAELSNAIYDEKNILEAVVRKRGLKLNKIANVSGVEVSYALVTDPVKKRYIIVVRGTANVENAIVDMDVKLIEDQQTGIRLHQGFLKASKPIFNQLRTELKKEYDIVTTGHSLGGAVAVILGMQLQSDHFKVSEVVTFGQPKVTNIGGANKFKDLKVLRFVRPKDMVPIVPPVDPLDLQNLDIYWHLGSEIILMENNEYAELEGVSSMLRGVDFVTIAPSEENLESHKMTGYSALINGHLQKSTKVEYKSSFSLKNLFSSD